jgi:hypothetical protein
MSYQRIIHKKYEECVHLFEDQYNNIIYWRIYCNEMIKNIIFMKSQPSIIVEDICE